MSAKQKLELTWIGKHSIPRLEPRILIEDPRYSYGVGGPSDHATRDNLLIHGDNLLGLRALEEIYPGQVKCVYIDPPFNTGQAFEHYDDGVEHSLWLDLMAKRIHILHKLLRPDGIIYIHLDQEEVHYLKILADEIFDRRNFLGQIAYERSGVSGIGQGGSFLVNTHEYILCYAKNRTEYRPNNLNGRSDLEPETMKRYSRILVHPGSRKEVNRFIAPSTGRPVVIYKHTGENIGTISLRSFDARKEEIEREYFHNFEKIFRLTSIQKENEFQNKIISLCGDGLYSADYLVSRGKKEGENTTAYFFGKQAAVWLRDTALVSDGKVVRSAKMGDFWPHADIPKANLANEGGVEFRRGKKPEYLLQRLIEMSTAKGDIVLDSFAGSGSTGAVAHKLERRWIMIELGEHCVTHVVPRIKSVINGSDNSGISQVSGWKGGGSFRYFTLGPSLIAQDEWGRDIIASAYRQNSAMLIEAMCKLHGYAFRPSETYFWLHGQSTERDFIYVTTQSMSKDQVAAISDEVGLERTLLICCGSHRLSDLHQFPNITVEKIPKSVLEKCEWGKDDYSLKIHNLPVAEDVPEVIPEAERAEAAVEAPKRKRGRPRKNAQADPRQASLFDALDATEAK